MKHLIGYKTVVIKYSKPVTAVTTATNNSINRYRICNSVRNNYSSNCYKNVNRNIVNR
jgi:hypothetical protein